MVAGDLGELSDADWNRLQSLIASFEAAWWRGDRPRIADHLPDGEPCREALVVELVHAELEFRLKAGESARVEEYLHRYPTLGRDRSAVLGLIQAEWSLRRRREPDLTLDRYQTRFPDFRADLADSPGEAVTHVAPGRSTRPGPRPPAPAEAPLPRRFGKFELRERVGAGSFGVVYRAWDTVLQREVAVKVPRPEAVVAPSDVRAFLREARNAIELRHPNIVAIHDAGPIEGTVCLVRSFIEGPTLAERLRDHPFAPEEAAALMALVAEALDHAHGRGIFHRDLKPSNILIGPDGQPHVSDFGLAKRESGDTTLSPAGQVGTLIGTPAYMSPEQARGEAYLVDARSDVYSAGVVLYELLTGSVPFRGRGRMLQLQIQEDEPAPPRSLNDEAPRDLEAICLRALAKAPQDRYPTARALADDLRSFLGGRPIGPRREVRAASPRNARRRVGLAAPIVALLVGLAVMTALWQTAESRRARDAQGLGQFVRTMLDLASLPYARGSDGPEAHRRVVDRIWAASPGLVLFLGDDPSLRSEMADALIRLAARKSELGPDRESSWMWARAVELGEVLVREHPGDLNRREDLARSLAELAEVRRRAGAPAEAARLFDRALALRGEVRNDRRRRANERPADIDAQLAFAEAEVRTAEVALGAGRLSEVDFDEADRIGVRLAGGTPREPGPRRRLARLDLGLARLHRAALQPLKSLQAARRGIQLGEEPSPDPEAEADLARLTLALARSSRDLGRDDEALEGFRRAAERFEALSIGDLLGPDLRRDLGAAYFEVGRLLDREGRTDEAVEAYQRSLGVLQALARSYPGSPAVLADRGATRAALASVLDRRGEPLAAASALLGAIVDEAAASFLEPGIAAHRRDLARHVAAIARMIRATPEFR